MIKQNTCYVKPFIPFCAVLQMTFGEINELNKTAHYDDTKYTSGAMYKLSKTWILEDPAANNFITAQTVQGQMPKFNIFSHVE